MRNMILICIALMTFSCASKTEFGNCVGINDTKDSKLNYEYSVRNIAVGIIFLEMIVPPLVVVFNKLECPVSKK